MNNRTIAAINTIAGRQSTDFDVEHDDDSVTVKTFYTVAFSDEYVTEGRYLDRSVEAHKLSSGRWILAHWSDHHSQWQSTDFSRNFAKYNPQAVYCFSRKLDSLAGDIKTYPSSAAAVRAAFQSD